MVDGDLKPWRCRNGHTLGIVKRTAGNVRQLMFFRQAIGEQTALTEMAEVDVACMFEGYVADVRCSVCGAIQSWIPGQEALRHMLRELKREGPMANPGFGG